MEVAKIFSDGEDQLVALPKNFRFNSKEVFVNRVGDAVILWGCKELDTSQLLSTCII